MKITIEKRVNKQGDKEKLRLVFWYGSYTDANGKTKHRRKLEQLNLFLYINPNSKIDKQHKKETLQLVEAIQAKRVNEAASGQHGFTDTTKINASFYGFFSQVMETKKNNQSSSNYSVWQGSLIMLKRYHIDENLTFEQITPEWLEGLKRYLDTQAKTKSGNPISKGTASSYFNKVRAVINAAAAKGIITRNPLTQVKGIKAEQNERVYLAIEEVRELVKTECRYEVLKRAFLFLA